VQSGRKTGKATTGKGNPYLKAALGQMAMGAAKTETFLGARYRRLAKRMPKGVRQFCRWRGHATLV